MRVYTGTPNPLNNSKYRNLKCFCGSNKKLKKCHGEFRFVKNKYLILFQTYENFLLGNLEEITWLHFLNDFTKKMKEEEEG